VNRRPGALTRGIGSVFIDSFEAELADGSAA
jgi:hypothetical protein